MRKKNNNKSYKASFILDTRNYEEPIEEFIEKLTGIVEAIHGVVKKVENLGQMEFQRFIDRKFPHGIYLQMFIEGPSTVPATLKEKLHLDKTVNRILVETV